MTEKRRRKRTTSCSRLYTEGGNVTRETPAFVTSKKYYTNCGLILFVVIVVAALLAPASSTLCKRDLDCPSNRICFNSHSGKGICRCKEGTIAWKWRCYASGKSLGDPCRISLQCNVEQNQICDPLSKTCVCEKKFNSPLRTSFYTCGDTTFNMYFNASSNETARDSLLSQESSSSSPSFPSQGLNEYQMSTLLYIGLSLSVVVLLGLLSLAYRKMVQEKKQSQAAIKGLLELISENQSLNSFCSTISDDELVIVRSDGRNSSSNSGGNPYCISDKLHLPPLSGEGTEHIPRFPAPHLSTPILPPIKRPSGPPSLASFPPPSLK